MYPAAFKVWIAFEPTLELPPQTKTSFLVEFVWVPALGRLSLINSGLNSMADDVVSPSGRTAASLYETRSGILATIGSSTMEYS
ncbi:hypothetical protein HG530_005687 [Fusarium avenaceum]|nr:hypothetical protein HG530_005687 [Fusarium avenaceum]